MARYRVTGVTGYRFLYNVYRKVGFFWRLTWVFSADSPDCAVKEAKRRAVHRNFVEEFEIDG